MLDKVIFPGIIKQINVRSELTVFLLGTFFLLWFGLNFSKWPRNSIGSYEVR